MADFALKTAMAFIGSLGFSLIFNVRGRRMFLCAAGGAVQYGSYLLIYEKTGSIFVSFFFSSLLVAVLSELLARITKTPVILLLVPMLVPLIPGGDLYNTMFHLIRQNMPEFEHYGLQLIVEVAAINFAIVVSATLSHSLTAAVRFLKENGHR